MINNIGEREKGSLPFVNMCLRSWMIRLSEDGNLWPQIDTLDYDVWLTEELNKTGVGSRPGKTSFQIMMPTFGNTNAMDTSISAADRMSNEPPKQIMTNEKAADRTSNEPPKQIIANKKIVNSLARKDGPGRISQIQRVGKELRKKLLVSSGTRIQYRSAKRADKALSKLIPGTVDLEHSKAMKDVCGRAAQRMEELLFTNGGAGRLLLTLKYFRERPAMRELKALKKLPNVGVANNNNSIYYTKTEKMNRILTNDLKGFLHFFVGNEAKKKLAEDRD